MNARRASCRVLHLFVVFALLFGLATPLLSPPPARTAAGVTYLHGDHLGPTLRRRPRR